MALPQGGRLQFGAGSDHWVLEDARAPLPFARAAGGAERVGTEELLSLEEDPPAALWRDPEGRWWLEVEDGLHPAQDRDTVLVNGMAWTLFLPTEIDPTWEASTTAPSLSRALLRFAVSADEETVQLSLEDGSHHLDLGARTAHYHLLVLARLRLSESQDPATDAAEAGWVHMDQLTRMLRCEANQVNVYVHRVRRSLAEAGVAGAARIVERRQRQGMLRFGTARVEVVPLGLDLAGHRSGD